MAGIFKFTFGPWNIHEGSDPFGPVVRKTVDFDRKLEYYKELGYDAIQFHDDDAVPELNNLSTLQIVEASQSLRKRLSDKGLAAEFVAPRLWEDPRTIDGGYTANNEKDRKYAIERSKIAIDIAEELGTDLIVLWLAREGLNDWWRPLIQCLSTTRPFAFALSQNPMNQWTWHTFLLPDMQLPWEC